MSFSDNEVMLDEIKRPCVETTRAGNRGPSPPPPPLCLWPLKAGQLEAKDTLASVMFGGVRRIEGFVMVVVRQCAKVKDTGVGEGVCLYRFEYSHWLVNKKWALVAGK